MASLKCPRNASHYLEAYMGTPSRMWCGECQESYLKTDLMRSLSTPEPPPTTSNRPAVWDLVITDIVERDNVGAKKYKTRLQPFNGRDVLIDLYQELLDAVVYCRQAIYERDGK